jgi:hypothetical protein
MRKLFYVMTVTMLFCSIATAQTGPWAATNYTSFEQLASHAHLDNPPFHLSQRLISQWGRQYNQTDPGYHGGIEDHWGSKTVRDTYSRTLLVDPTRVAWLENTIETLQNERHVVESEIITVESVIVSIETEISYLNTQLNAYLNGGFNDFHDKSAPEHAAEKVVKQEEREDRLIERQTLIDERDVITTEISTNISEYNSEIQNTRDETFVTSNTTNYYHYYN